MFKTKIKTYVLCFSFFLASLMVLPNIPLGASSSSAAPSGGLVLGWWSYGYGYGYPHYRVYRPYYDNYYYYGHYYAPYYGPHYFYRGWWR